MVNFMFMSTMFICTYSILIPVMSSFLTHMHKHIYLHTYTYLTLISNFHCVDESVLKSCLHMSNFGGHLAGLFHSFHFRKTSWAFWSNFGGCVGSSQLRSTEEVAKAQLFEIFRKIHLLHALVELITKGQGLQVAWQSHKLQALVEVEPKCQALQCRR